MPPPAGVSVVLIYDGVEEQRGGGGAAIVAYAAVCPPLMTSALCFDSEVVDFGVCQWKRNCGLLTFESCLYSTLFCNICILHHHHHHHYHHLPYLVILL